MALSRWFPGLIVALGALAPTDAFGWMQSTIFRASVHHHEFDKIAIENDGCKLNVTLWFTAPEDRYSDPNPVRNQFRFDARVKLDDREFRTGVFRNEAPGRRRFHTVIDTTADGCWAKNEHKVRDVDVNGCRNRNCRVPD